MVVNYPVLPENLGPKLVGGIKKIENHRCGLTIDLRDHIERLTISCARSKKYFDSSINGDTDWSEPIMQELTNAYGGNREKASRFYGVLVFYHLIESNDMWRKITNHRSSGTVYKLI